LEGLKTIAANQETKSARKVDGTAGDRKASDPSPLFSALEMAPQNGSGGLRTAGEGGGVGGGGVGACVRGVRAGRLCLRQSAPFAEIWRRAERAGDWPLVRIAKR
jgi:hypothetical protein